MQIILFYFIHQSEYMEIALMCKLLFLLKMHNFYTKYKLLYEMFLVIKILRKYNFHVYSGQFSYVLKYYSY